MQNQEMVDEILNSLKEDLKNAINHQKNDYQIIRAGRANPHILDRVSVEYYGSLTPINQMANISVPEARIIAISVWDVSQIKNVSKAIMAADLGVNPTDDGKIIRLIFPTLTEERRKEIVKQIKKIAEDTKVALRNARRDALELLKQMKKDGDISEDEFATLEKEVQKLIDLSTADSDKNSQEKEKEVMEV